MTPARRFRSLSLRAFSAGLAALLCGAPATALCGTATFSGIGDLPGGGFSSAVLDVSPDGTTVVGRGLASPDVDSLEAVRWTALGGMVSLGDGGIGLQQTSAWGTSTNGAVIVGRAYRLRQGAASVSKTGHWPASYRYCGGKNRFTGGRTD